MEWPRPVFWIGLWSGTVLGIWLGMADVGHQLVRSRYLLQPWALFREARHFLIAITTIAARPALRGPCRHDRGSSRGYAVPRGPASRGIRSGPFGGYNYGGNTRNYSSRGQGSAGGGFRGGGFQGAVFEAVVAAVAAR